MLSSSCQASIWIFHPVRHMALQRALATRRMVPSSTKAGSVAGWRISQPAGTMGSRPAFRRALHAPSEHD